PRGAPKRGSRRTGRAGGGNPPARRASLRRSVARAGDPVAATSARMERPLARGGARRARGRGRGCRPASRRGGRKGCGGGGRAARARPERGLRTHRHGAAGGGLRAAPSRPPRGAARDPGRARSPPPPHPGGVGAQGGGGRALAAALARISPDGGALAGAARGAGDRPGAALRANRAYRWIPKANCGTGRAMTTEAQPKVEIRPVADAGDLAAALAIREVVFIEEQQVPAEIERDDEDPTAYHVLALVDVHAIGTGRLVE